MDKFFPTLARHAKAREFLELKQGSMTMLKYVAKFIELAHFEMTMWPHIWLRRGSFKDGLKLSIWGKIVGFLL